MPCNVTPSTPEVFEQLIDSAPLLFFSVGCDLTYTYINPFFAEVHNIDQQKAVGMHMSEVIGEEGFNNNLPHYKKVLQGESIRYDSFFVKADGNPHHYHAIYKPLYENGDIIGFTGVVVDITAEKQLEELSNTDALTKVNNRRKYETDLQKVLEKDDAERYGLILLDIDFFKLINDELGHDKGDDALVRLSTVLKEVVADSGKIYRIGGEEFVVILDNVIDQENLEQRTETIRQAVESYNILDDRKVTVSIGASVIVSGDEKRGLVKRVDEALYKAKESGRNRSHFV
ncbi:sensor domain-containing diguanylate cyclase [Vibrio rumoiensis]|uniref:sensor domain-containing diguanylate cyclase n=1 Tax=Vibrio rumoiensis TaxID=76258 RepID=UPI000B5CFBEF|nr:GGDEF domain-containing protein [Vibrio rumoiensis]